MGDGHNGLPSQAPFDAIHVGAASPDVPPALLEQLKNNGRLVIPIGGVNQVLVQIDKGPDGTITRKELTTVKYVPLVHGISSGIQ